MKDIKLSIREAKAVSLFIRQLIEMIEYPESPSPDFATLWSEVKNSFTSLHELQEYIKQVLEEIKKRKQN